VKGLFVLLYAAVVGPGVYTPLFPAGGEREIPVDAFLLARRQVTNAEFLAFVEREPRWRRDRVRRMFADEGYLAHWAGATDLGAGADPRSPVVNVSWFAAKAYCEHVGGRLPTEAEWELAAVGPSSDEILAWYARPARGPLRPAGSGPANRWGVRDLHGLVWEWVYDFGATMVAGDDRERGDGGRFCGFGGLDARDPRDYATFMRLAMRNSLSGHFTTASLGFRCARDL
jgi:formylglycine-generating enzyme required for sulfatase activity